MTEQLRSYQQEQVDQLITSSIDITEEGCPRCHTLMQAVSVGLRRDSYTSYLVCPVCRYSEKE